LEAKIAALEAEREVQKKEFAWLLDQGQSRKQAVLGARAAIRESRGLAVQNPENNVRPNGRGGAL
jgi:hypothetical protein